jgi:hypothetical protein
VNTFQSIGPRPGNNLFVHEVAHMTVNGHGDVTVARESLSIDCK